MRPSFAGERVVVVGAGVAGRAAARVLVDGGADVLVSESRPASEVEAAAAEVAAMGAAFEAGGHRPEQLDGATVVVVSPGVPASAEVLAWADRRRVPVWSEMELGARVATRPYVAVTGTNGKTTTTGMIASILRAAGHDAVACGNIGHPFTLAAIEPHDVLVVEVSSFQLLHQTSFHPVVSVLLNVASDHVDAHGSLEAYREAKAAIIRGASPTDLHVGNADDPVAAAISASAPCRIRWFRSGQPADDEVGFDGDMLVSAIDGRHEIGAFPDRPAGFRSDAAAAVAAAAGLGADARAGADGLADFEPAPHRGEVVAEVAGVRFIDDSKATNVHAARAAIARVDDAVLIAGGLAKGQDLSALAADAPRLRGVVTIGEAAGQIASVFDGLVPVERAGDIETATRRAFDMAAPSGVVLLAPACASWDQFRDYAERGDRFAAAARALGSGDG